MNYYQSFINTLYDKLVALWEGPAGHRLAGSLLVICFIFAMCLVELNRFFVLPETLIRLIPKNHLAAIEATLTLLLIIEIMGLVFSLVKSVTVSVGRQLEILSLILLRNVFKEISHFSEPLIWSNFSDQLVSLSFSSFGALIIFGILCLFYNIRRREALTGYDDDKKNFILAKKTIALGLLICFHAILIKKLVVYLSGGSIRDPFELFFTLLIISDILIVFISMRYGHDYQIAFRNSAFAVVTVFIRVSLISPPVYNAVIGVGASVFALSTLFIYSFFLQTNKHQTSQHADRNLPQ